MRLHFDGFDIDINSHLRSIVVDEMGPLEELGLLSVAEADHDVLDIPEVGANTAVFDIGEVARDVTVVNDVICV